MYSRNYGKETTINEAGAVDNFDAKKGEGTYTYMSL